MALTAPLPPDRQRALLAEAGRLLREHAPAGWQRIEADIRQAAGQTELSVRVADAERVVTVPAPPGLADLLTELRSGMYEPGRGTWLRAHYSLDSSSAFDFDFALDAQPDFRDEPGDPARVFAAELEAHPRRPEHIPHWWRLRAGLPLDTVFRHARIVDSYTEGEPPVVDRPPLPESEIEPVSRYLEREPAVLSGREPGPDIFTGGADRDVPESYHTDGTWVWHASVPHYLRKHGVPPETELLEHIRALRFSPPHVEDLVRRTVAADLLGTPRPAPDIADTVPTAADQVARWETDADPRLTDESMLAVLAQRIAEHGVWPQAYRVGERADEAWCLNSTARGWEVAPHDGGLPVDPVYFARFADAAQYLLGALVMFPARRTAGYETPVETARALADWPIQPAEGEPPLTLLRNKRMLRLPAGTEVWRFGGEQGNLVHHGGVRFPTTSLPLERERERHEYRLLRSLYVITGITVAWANLPGGAVAYVLGKTIGEHLAEGSLERIR